ncbi:hypothetical protein DPEC_G00078400 [Dallia pectoralis]|uniref:Uncharacterized protein n=1 Tax=Dallia pectoralis TaxID=75939 RepID=A0ACC2H4X6_DALPE|nr:hypothetical protein DPEC_G00078400 [Dallia pectoralis]
MLNANLCILAVMMSLLFVAFVPNTQAADCCLKYTRHPVSCGRLKDFTLQDLTSSCDLNAVILHTRKVRKFICADPTQAWTQRVVKCLKKRIQKEFKKTKN